jgi:dolichyl-diphosphooligosaccharide--protein glycosyltransferase
MSWWDYGYWITSIAHRIPNASPNGQAGAVDAGSFFTAQDESSANQVLDKLGSKYVIIDYSMAAQTYEYGGQYYATVGGKFYAMATWAGKSPAQFYDYFYRSTQTGGYQPVMYYYPAYYQSMSARLYNFECQEWVPQQVVVISWIERQLTSTDGGTFTAKVISDQKSFSTYNEARVFVDAHPGYLIVGTSPLYSPIPLQKLEHYKLIYQSPSAVLPQAVGNGTISAVEIFEYSP